MASLDDRLRFPDDRTTFIFQGAYLPILTPPITSVTIYADQGATALADILDPSGNGISGSTLHTDASGLLPEFYGPTGNITRVWALVPGASGTPSPLDAQTAGLLTALGGAGTVTQVAGVNPDESGHVPLTATNVGADPAGAASTAQTNAETFATNAIAAETSRAETAEAARYTKPAPGIPATDLTTAVQTSLDLANTALQSAPVTSFNGRTGAISPTTGDYTAAEVGADPSGAASTAQSTAETFATNAVATETGRAEGAEGTIASNLTAETSRAEAAEALLAPKASPALTGTPTAPTQAALTNSTVVATTAYTDTAVGVETARAETAEATKATSSALTTEVSRAEAAEALLAPKASPVLTGTPTAPTATALTNTTQVATTAYTDAAVAVETGRAEGAESTLTSSIAAKYTKPGTGIPSTDMATAVQTSLGLANTALQPGGGGTGTVTSVTATNATITVGGTAAAPTIAVGTVPSGNLAAGVQTDLSLAASAYQKPGPGIPSTDLTTAVQTSLGLANSALQSAPVTSVAGKTGVVSLVEGDIANLTTDLAAKAPLASPALTGTPTVPTAGALTNTTQAASTAYADAAVSIEKARALAAEGLAVAKANNLSDLASASTARTNLGLGTAATLASSAVAQTANNLSDLASASTARTNLGLGTAATQATSAFLQASNNLSDVASATTARGNLAAAPLASPTFTGTPAAPTATALTNTTQLATTAYADTAVGVETTRAQVAEAGREILAPPAVLTRGRATVITTYASGHGWTASGFASSNVNDTADGRLSGQMLTGTTTGNSGNFPTFTKTGASALAIYGNCVRVWVKVDVPTNVTAITLRVADAGGLAASRYISWTALASSGGVYRTNGVLIPPNTWTELSFSLGSAFTSGTPNLAALTEYRWICQDNGTAFTAHFGGIEVYSALGERYPNGVVCLGFDDCYSGQYSLAMNLLSAYGYQATIFPIIDQIGQSGSWSLAQLQQMVNIGWEVAPHASTLTNHSNWNTLTNAQQTADVQTSQAWIAAQGFGLSGAFAYPLGGFNGGADAAVAPLVNVARTIDSTLLTETLPVGNPLHMRSAAGVGGTGGIGVTTYTTATTGVLALAKAAGSLVPITIHDVSSGTSTNINQISIADLTTLIAAIASAGMAVATYAEVIHYAMSALVSPTFYEYQVINLPTDLAAKAPLASPTLTGVPAAPTASALTNTTQVATTAYADAAVAVEKTRALAAEALLAPLASPAFTTTASVLGNYAKIGPTAYTFTVPSVSGGYLVLDKSLVGSDASVVFRDTGAAKGEVGLATDDNLHLKTATGAAGSETYTDALVLMNATAYAYVPVRLGIGTSSPGNSLHVAASSSAGRAGIKIENTASVSGNSNSALVELKGNSPTAAVDWLFGTDYGENGNNNWFVQDSNNGLRLFVDSTGRLVLGDSTAGPAAANSLDVVGSIKTRGTNSLTPLNICGRSTAFGAPTSGTWQVNDAVMDVSGDWYYCTGAGTPGTWRSLSIGSSAVRLLGYAALNLDPAVAISTATPTAGYIYFNTMYVENPNVTVGHINTLCLSAGSGLSNCYFGVYDVLTGNRLGLTADISSSLGTTGAVSAALVTPISGLTWNQQLYVALLIGAGASTGFAGGHSASGNLGSSNFRIQVKVGSATSLPSTMPTGLTVPGSQQQYAFGLGV